MEIHLQKKKIPKEKHHEKRHLGGTTRYNPDHSCKAINPGRSPVVIDTVILDIFDIALDFFPRRSSYLRTVPLV